MTRRTCAAALATFLTLYALQPLHAAAPLADALEKPVPAFSVDASLADALTKLSQAAAIPIRLDTARVLAAAHIHLDLASKPLADILDALLAQASPTHDLAYAIENDALVITTNHEDVAVFDIPDIVAPAEKTGDPFARDLAVTRLIEKITATVDPPSWTEEHFAEIREYAGHLHVRQNLQNLAAITRLLHQLRNAPAAATEPAALVMDDRKGDDALDARLSTKRITLAFTGPLEEAARKLQQASDFNVLLEWKDLAPLGIDRTTPVAIDAKNEPLADVLTRTLAQCKNARGKVGFMIDDGILQISTLEKLETYKFTPIQIYDVRDLLRPNPGAAAQPAPIPAGRAQALIDDIKQNIKPATWEKGKSGTIRDVNGQLAVQQSADVHRAIKNYIQLLRRARNVQVTIESKLVTLSPAALKTLRPLAPLDRHPPKADGAPDAYCLIDDDNTSRLLKLLQDDPSISLTTSPRLTLFLNQEAVSRTGGDEIDAITAWKKNADGADEPVTETVYTGVELDLRTTLTPDGHALTTDIDLVRRFLSGEAITPAAGKPGTAQTITTARIAGTFAIPEGRTLVALGPETPDKRRYLLILRNRLALPRIADYPLVPLEGAGTVHPVK
jgi:hypothetical protein